MQQIALSLGSNLGNSANYLSFAINKISKNPSYTIWQVSKVYKTKAWGGVASHDFLNQILILNSSSHPQLILKDLQSIETHAGRNRNQELRWGNRTLDIDILFIDSMVYNKPNLIIPHPHLHNRAFFLQILVDMGLGGWKHPILQKNIHELLNEKNQEILSKI